MSTLYTKRQAAEILQIHPEHVMVMVREGRFPKPIKFGPHANSAVRFLSEEVEAWLEDRAAARDCQTNQGGV